MQMSYRPHRVMGKEEKDPDISQGKAKAVGVCLHSGVCPVWVKKVTQTTSLSQVSSHLPHLM